MLCSGRDFTRLRALDFCSNRTPCRMQLARVQPRRALSGTAFNTRIDIAAHRFDTHRGCTIYRRGARSRLLVQFDVGSTVFISREGAILITSCRVIHQLTTRSSTTDRRVVLSAFETFGWMSS